MGIISIVRSRSSCATTPTPPPPPRPSSPPCGERVCVANQQLSNCFQCPYTHLHFTPESAKPTEVETTKAKRGSRNRLRGGAWPFDSRNRLRLSPKGASEVGADQSVVDPPAGRDPILVLDVRHLVIVLGTYPGLYSIMTPDVKITGRLGEDC